VSPRVPRPRLPLPGLGSSRAAACPCGSDSRLSARGSFRVATCPYGSGSRLPAPGLPHVPVTLAPVSRLGAARGPPRVASAPAPAFWLRAALKLSSVMRMSSTSCKQLNKYLSSKRVHAYLSRHYASRAAPHLRKACNKRPIKYRRDAWPGRS
jgi:hypothetical protein